MLVKYAESAFPRLLTWTGVEAGGMGLSTAINLDLGHGPSRISVLLKLMMSGIVTV